MKKIITAILVLFISFATITEASATPWHHHHRHHHHGDRHDRHM